MARLRVGYWPKWDSPAAVFPADVRAAYVEALGDPAHVHAICEDYRAAATLDRKHDEVDRVSGRRIVARCWLFGVLMVRLVTGMRRNADRS